MIIALLLGGLQSGLKAQHISFDFGFHHLYETPDTLRSFNLIRGDADLFISKMKQGMLSSPELINEGTFVWKKVNIPGIGNELCIEINDGIFEYDATGKTACFTSLALKI